MSQLELRLLTALAVQKKCIPKTADFIQAFCQSDLPENETYICKPPPGCPITEKGLYLKLKKTIRPQTIAQTFLRISQESTHQHGIHQASNFTLPIYRSPCAKSTTNLSRPLCR